MMVPASSRERTSDDDGDCDGDGDGDDDGDGDGTCCLSGKPQPRFHIVERETGCCSQPVMARILRIFLFLCMRFV